MLENFYVVLIFDLIGFKQLNMKHCWQFRSRWIDIFLKNMKFI